MNKPKDIKDCGFLPSYVVESVNWRKIDAIRLRYGLDETLNRKVAEPMTLKQLGEVFKLSREQVRQLCMQGLEMLWRKKQLFRKDTLRRRVYFYAIASTNFSPFVNDLVAITEIEKEILSTPVEQLEFSRRTLNQLKRRKMDTVGDIIRFSPDELLGLPGVGRVIVEEIIEKLCIFEDLSIEKYW